MIAAAIKAYLKDNGIKYAHVANKAGMQRKGFSNSLHGKRSLKVEEAVAICKVLGKPLEYFIEEGGRVNDPTTNAS